MIKTKELANNLLAKITSLTQNEKNTCRKYGKQTSKILVRHKERCLVGPFLPAILSNFSTRRQTNLSFLIARKLSLSQLNNVHKCQLCHQVFGGIYSLQLHRQKVHNAQTVSATKKMDVTQLVGEVDGESSKEELEACNHFLVDSKIENGRNRVFTSAIEKLDSHTFSQKLNTVFEKLKCAAKLNVAYG